MEWVLAIVAGGGVLLLLAPLVLTLGGLVLLGLFGHVLPGGAAVSRVSFDCPFSRRRVTAEFLTAPGTEEPADVLSCDAFAKPYHVRCKKDCLGLAHAGWAASAMMPRYALLSGGVAVRPLAEAGASTPGSGPDGQVSRAA
jgi:hypothetical protein